jgi:hypothetical protein
MHQALDYIHNNPVEAGIKEKPEDYLHSSARNYYGVERHNRYYIISTRNSMKFSLLSVVKRSALRIK